MAQTAQEFLDKTVGHSIWSMRNAAQKFWDANEGRTADLRIPIWGCIRQTEYQKMSRGDEHELISNQIEFYLVDRDGKEYRFWQFINPQQVQPDMEALTRIIEIMQGISGLEELMEAASAEYNGDFLIQGERSIAGEKPHEDHRDFYKWMLFSIPEQFVRRLYDEAGLTVVAEYVHHLTHRTEKAARTVFPETLRVEAITDAFDLSKAARFIRFHNDCAEYRTMDGVTIFDHRTIDYEFGKPSKNGIWRNALRRYASRFSASEESDNPAKRFAWEFLRNLGGTHDGYQIEPAARRRLIDKLLPLFQESAYSPIADLLHPDNSGYAIEVRKVYRDRDWKDDELGGNVFNPTYVVIRDTEEAKASLPELAKGVIASASFSFSDMTII